MSGYVICELKLFWVCYFFKEVIRCNGSGRLKNFGGFCDLLIIDVFFCDFVVENEGKKFLFVKFFRLI